MVIETRTIRRPRPGLEASKESTQAKDGTEELYPTIQTSTAPTSQRDREVGDRCLTLRHGWAQLRRGDHVLLPDSDVSPSSLHSLPPLPLARGHSSFFGQEGSSWVGGTLPLNTLSLSAVFLRNRVYSLLLTRAWVLFGEGEGPGVNGVTILLPHPICQRL